MSDRQINIPDLAAYCKLDRSTVYKFIKGSRVPSEISTVENISDYLRLNESDRQMLFDSYSIAQIGSKRFLSRKAIEKGIKTLMGIQLPVKKAPVILVDEPLSENRPVIALTNPLVIKEWIRRILIQCYSKTNEELRILTRFQHQELMEMIFPFADHDLKVKHILPMRGRMKAGTSEQQSDSLNCENVLQIIPHIMCHTDYDVYYYYTNYPDLDNGINHPYMISCSTIVVTFSNDLTSGIVYRDPEIVSYFNKSFEVKLKSCRRLFESIRESTNLVKFLSDTASYYEGSNLRLTYQMDPGLVPLLKPYHIKKYMIKEIPGRNELIHSFVPYCNLILEEVRTPGSMHFYWLDGFIDFMESGRIRELPDFIYTPFEPGDRLSLMQSMVKLAESMSNFGLIRKDFTVGNTGLMFEIHDNIMFIQFHRDDGVLCEYNIPENSMVEDFLDYFDNCWQDLVYDREESIRMLKEMVEEYEKKIKNQDGGSMKS